MSDDVIEKMLFVEMSWASDMGIVRELLGELDKINKQLFEFKELSDDIWGPINEVILERLARLAVEVEDDPDDQSLVKEFKKTKTDLKKYEKLWGKIISGLKEGEAIFYKITKSGKEPSFKAIEALKVDIEQSFTYQEVVNAFNRFATSIGLISVRIRNIGQRIERIKDIKQDGKIHPDIKEISSLFEKTSEYMRQLFVHVHKYYDDFVEYYRTK